MNSVTLKYVISFIGAAILIAASFIWRPVKESEGRLLISPPPYIQYFTFGHREVFADSLWIRALQDYDYCEEQIAKNICRGNGWLFHMLDTITELSPKFRKPFATGALALSVIVSDIEGASKIFDKAVVQFPTDWQITYRAAYHALIEEKNKFKAAKLMEATARNGGLPWMYSLATRLYSDAGEKELAFRLYQELKADPTTDPAVLKRMAKKLGLPD